METQDITIKEQWDRIEERGGKGAGWLDNTGYVHTRESYVGCYWTVSEPVYGYRSVESSDKSLMCYTAPLGSDFGAIIPADLVDKVADMQPTNLDQIAERINGPYHIEVRYPDSCGSGEHWSATGHGLEVNDFLTIAEAKEKISELAKIFSCSEDDLRVVDDDGDVVN